MKIQKQFISWVVAVTLGFAGAALRADDAAPETLITAETAELIDVPDLADPPLGDKPPEASPAHDGYADQEERIKAGEAAATDPRAEAPDETLAPARVLPPGEAPVADGSSMVTRSFAGLNYVASGRRETPDVSLARSPNRVLQATNGALRLFDTSGTVRATRFMDSFFGLTGVAAGTTDPKVYYDRLTSNPRLVIVVIGLGTPNGLHLAISRKPDPDTLNTADWCRYRIPHPSIAPQAIVDYPGLGAGPEHLIVTTNHFDASGRGATLVRLLSKQVVYGNSATFCPQEISAQAVLVPPAAPDRASLQTLQPVQFATAPAPSANQPLGYLVSALQYGSTGYRVWSLQRNATGQLVIPLPFSEVFARKRYLLPPPARQTSQPANSLDTGDGRILQAVGYGNSIWFTQTTGCNNSGTTGVNEACARVLRADITPRSGPPGVVLGQEVSVGGGPGVFLWMPAIAVTAQGHIALAYHQGSASLPMGTRSAIKTANASSFTQLSTDAGTCTRTGSVRRSGDFLGAQVDPSGATLWLAGERLSTLEGSCWWESVIKEVLP